MGGWLYIFYKTTKKTSFYNLYFHFVRPCNVKYFGESSETEGSFTVFIRPGCYYISPSLMATS